MSLSFLTPNRTVLVISDEALYIYACGSKGPRLVEAVPWQTEDFEQNVAGILTKDCGGKPVLIINDMVEQHYRKERILRRGVGFLDKSQVLRRKLAVAFPSYPIRAFLPLKEKLPKSDKGGAADIYIFAAVPESKQFQSAVAAVNLSLAPIIGYCLLPVEAADMVKVLSAKVIKKGSKVQWVVFVGQHRHGGLRQIVIKNGELALTRMTPVTDDDGDPQAWAGEVYQEFNATMSYLSRFGFQPEDGLHVIAVASDDGGDALQSMMEESFGFTSVTSGEAARMLGMPFGDMDDPRYADTLHVGWVGRKPKPALPLKSVKIDKFSRPRQTAMAASLVLFLGIMYLGYVLISEGATISGILSELEESNQRLAQLNVQYQKEVQRKEELGFDVRLVQSSIAVHDALEKDNIKSLLLLRDIGKALGKDMRVDTVKIWKPDNLINIDLTPDGQTTNPPLYQASLEMTYPSTTDIDKGNQEVKDLRDRLQTTLTGATVTITKALKDYGYNKGLVIEAGDLQKQDVSQDFVAAIEIKGAPKP